MLLVAALWAACAAGVAWYAASVARQITYVTLADGRRQERSLPLIFRLLLPFAPNLTPVFRREPFANARRRLDQRLTAAGFEALLRPEELLALQVLMPLLLAILIMPFAVAVLRAAPASGRPVWVGHFAWMLPALVLTWAYFYPLLWLRRVLAQRHKSIQRALPFMLDLLTLSVEAGMDFMSAMQRAVERRNVDPLNEELIRVIREIQLGQTRRQALRAMAARVRLPDLRSVVSALVQADELGVSIGSILRIQSDQMRQRRFERAEKLAHEAPVKMLFPLMFFIFPSVFLVLLGPVITRLIRQGF